VSQSLSVVSDPRYALVAEVGPSSVVSPVRESTVTGQLFIAEAIFFFR